MRDEEINAAIAEACGWTAVEDKDGFWRAKDRGGWFDSRLWVSERNVHHQGFPRYTTDLNAMHDAETTIPRELHWQYQTELWGVFRPAMDTEKSLLGYLCATAAQRAEAFLRTIGKWKGKL